jgi:dTDP-4-amino-4,6-dideoxygalactose transaminase
MKDPMVLPSDANSSGREFGDDEARFLREALDSGNLFAPRGTQVKALEKEFAEHFGVAFAHGVTSGTAAVHVAIAAIDPEPGDEIITTPITDMGALTPIIMQTAVPVFADVDPVTLNVTPDTVAERITGRTRAIIVTHLFGQPVDMDGVMTVARRHGIPVIEDSAQAFDTYYKGKLCGTIGDIGCFSFQQTKHMTTGEGGMVVSNDPKLARLARLFRDKSWPYGEELMDHLFLGINYRMPELVGAVGRAQLARVASVVARRQETAKKFNALLSDVKGLTLAVPQVADSTHSYWKYPLIVDEKVIPGGAKALGAAVKERGVFVAPNYIQKPAYSTKFFVDKKTFGNSQFPYTDPSRAGLPLLGYTDAECPGAIKGLSQVLVVPWNEFYTDDHVRFIADTIKESVRCLTM